MTIAISVVYADSTIRRGKRSLRRNCFIYEIDSSRAVHIVCLSPLQGIVCVCVCMVLASVQSFSCCQVGVL